MLQRGERGHNTDLEESALSSRSQHNKVDIGLKGKLAERENVV
jgi:hypothetical protein